jgi:hypothetical protein
MSALFALSFPGLAILLVALVALERLGLWFAGHSWVPWRRKHTGMPVSAATLDVFAGVTDPGQRIDREELHAKMLMREDDEEGAPPRTRVDLDTGQVWLRPPE